MQVCTSAYGKTAVIATGKAYIQSTTAIGTSLIPRRCSLLIVQPALGALILSE